MVATTRGKNVSYEGPAVDFLKMLSEHYNIT